MLLSQDKELATTKREIQGKSGNYWLNWDMPFILKNLT
ncbi:hypothetical protein EV199_2516 [Pseudobacter ginsenosidimutans]|uniref:Uncharacterized protein n=1 Tax=Pseudobacter ginsenosidimutans TaxID=661488 RepID=A0A4Q7N6J4_9BACT|nr:hypothetical protein EV199_2516 [Pseudobacter ginsenosidimutans]